MAARSFFFDSLTGSRELRNSADRSGLGSLSAGVGVNLGIEDQDVDILAGSDDVVQAAEADVVCPAVAAEDPHGLLGEVILILQDLGLPVSAAGKLSRAVIISLGCRTVFSAVSHGLKPLLSWLPSALRLRLLRQRAHS